MATPDRNNITPETALSAFNPPPPDATAKQAALQAALAAFAEAQAAQRPDSENSAADGQGKRNHRRHPPETAAIMLPRPREGFMQRAKLLGRMTLGLVLVGTVGLVSYQSWHSSEPGMPYSAALRQAEQGSGTNSAVVTGAAQPMQPAKTQSAKNVEVLAAGASVGGGSSGCSNCGADLSGQIGNMAEQRPGPLAELRREWDEATGKDAAKSNENTLDKTISTARNGKEEEIVSDRIAPMESKQKSAAEPSLQEAPEGISSEAYTAEKNYTDAERAIAAPMNAPVSIAQSVAKGGMVAPVPTSVPTSPPLMQQMLRADDTQRQYYQDIGRDRFEEIKDNPALQVKEAPVSTFSLDVDTASYAFIRRSLNEGRLPRKDAVRVEELVNYFDYDYPLPDAREAPFQPGVTIMPTPWNAGTKLLHIGIKGYDLPKDKRPKANLVFLIDTSGSMDEPSKLPLARNALKLLVETLRPTDHVAIVTYAGSAGTALEPTAGSEKQKILNAIDNLGAGGSTAGAEGIRQAYELAKAHFDKEGVNRVILATDGDFNVGITDPRELQGYIERERQSGVFLSILGFGTGNYNDALMQKLAQNGNGIAAYIDNLNEARRVLVDEAGGTLFTIAKDVKIQVEFNPAMVSAYRLIGYETRALRREDFNNDKVDAGDVGAGADVTTLYEITTADSDSKLVDDLRYGDPAKYLAEHNKGSSNEYGFLKIRYKLPNGDASKLISTPITRQNLRGLCPPSTKCDAVAPSDDARFAAAVAGFGQILRGGTYTGGFGYDDVIALANGAKGKDEFGLRGEFVNLVRLAKNLPALPR